MSNTLRNHNIVPCTFWYNKTKLDGYVLQGAHIRPLRATVYPFNVFVREWDIYRPWYFPLYWTPNSTRYLPYCYNALYWGSRTEALECLLSCYQIGWSCRSFQSRRCPGLFVWTCLCPAWTARGTVQWYVGVHGSPRSAVQTHTQIVKRGRSSSYFICLFI